MNYTCPVCGYQKLRRPPEDYLICPSCGTEFGYTDFSRTWEELREEWKANGMQWYSPVIPKPFDFNPTLQLQELFEFTAESVTDNTQGEIEYDLNVEPVTFGDIKSYLRNYVVGASANNVGVGTGTL
jgi:hypothetical protein